MSEGDKAKKLEGKEISDENNKGQPNFICCIVFFALQTGLLLWKK